MWVIQFIIDILYRYPHSSLKMIKRFGGFLAYRNMVVNRNKMNKACLLLPPVYSFNYGLPIYFLTGQKYLYQTLFCIQSLSKSSSEKFCFNLVDDGSFNQYLINFLKQKLPGANIITAAIIEENLKNQLPEDQFRILLNKRKEYPHIKKITDIHTIKKDAWKLVLDSDMLFWDNPNTLISWLKNPQTPLHMIDTVQSYGYSIGLMEKLINNKIPSLVNVGVIGLKSETINWANLENWILELENAEGKSYYLEQALTAMLIANQKAQSLDKEDYVVNPTIINVQEKKNVLHHYVDLSKRWYFKIAWENFNV